MLYAKPNINISFIGQTYTGKSTLISNLINNLGDSDTINELDPLYKSLDNTQYRYKPVKTRYLSLFQINTEKTSFTLIDTPGESCYFRCLVTGIILTDVAILVTPSSKGELDLTHPRFGLTMYHSFFATELGTKQSIICVNKISENANTLTRSEFEEMRITILMLLTKARLTTENFIFIPISTCKKQNILEPCAEFSWYNGPTLLEVIKNLEHPKSNTEKPLRIIVYDSFQKLCNSLVVAGLIISGSLSVGQSVVFAPSGIIAEVQSIEILKKRIEVAWEGNIIGFFVRNVGYKDVKKGFVVSDLKNEPAKECEFFSAEIYILENPCKIKVGYSPIITIHTASEPCKIINIQKTFDKKTGVTLENDPEYLKAEDSAIVVMSPTKPMCVETFDDYPKLGRFVITDKGKIIAVGKVKEVLKKEIKYIRRS